MVLLPFHDVLICSQAETETLFPPLTMLSVMQEQQIAKTSATASSSGSSSDSTLIPARGSSDEMGSTKFMIYDKVETKANGEEVLVKEIHVRVSFV